MQTALRLSGVQKSFAGIPALRRGDVEVRSGEVHLLLGENGAGKSTMMRIAAGMLSPDAGSIAIHGREIRFRSPRDAQDAGIAMVHQESLLAPHLTVAENLFLGREPTGRCGTLRPRDIIDRARRIIAHHGLQLDAQARVGQLGPAARQLVEICRALVFEASILIFDEPTSSLSDAEAAQVFLIIDELRRQGRAIIYITHRMEELRRLGDHATVLRDGETVHSAPLSQTTTADLIRHMVGREQSEVAGRPPKTLGREALRLTDLSRKGAFENVSFNLRYGEVLGLAGLVGSGRSEICRAIFGIDSVHAGAMYIDGNRYNPESPRDAASRGLALIPEDRQLHGLASLRPTGENLSLAALSRFSRFGILNLKAEQSAVSQMIVRLNIRAASPAQPVRQLSGGNQQKTVLAKWLLAQSRIFLLDEPTRGVDVGAKAEVAALIDELARQGAAILLVSSELPELLQLSDRILVLRRGQLAADLPPTTSQEEIMRHAALT